MKIATWNIGEDEKNKNGKLDVLSYEYILKMIKQKKYRCTMLTRSNNKIRLLTTYSGLH